MTLRLYYYVLTCLRDHNFTGLEPVLQGQGLLEAG